MALEAPSRRGFLFGLGAALAAPAVIRIPGLLMPIRALARTTPTTLWVIAAPYTKIFHAEFTFDTLTAALAASIPGDTVLLAADHVETVPPEGISLPQHPITLVGGTYALQPNHNTVFRTRATLEFRDAVFTGKDAVASWHV